MAEAKDPYLIEFVRVPGQAEEAGKYQRDMDFHYQACIINSLRANIAGGPETLVGHKIHISLILLHLQFKCQDGKNFGIKGYRCLKLNRVFSTISDDFPAPVPGSYWR